VSHRATPLVPQRLPEKMRTDRAQLDELLDTTVLAHIGLVVDEHAAVFPTGFVRIDDQLVIHGSTGSHWMRALAGQDAAVTVTRIDGVVVARSTFESSMHYRSAMIFGRFAPVPAERTAAALDA
jgi:nitroimidazol reductase NimA-like FMN-containing flavoprotein (pyridoxamine 5'-phosphate oxidase superfamily)